VRVLDVVDGVVHRLLRHDREVHVDRRVEVLAQEVVAGDVRTDLLERLVERDHLAGALGEPHRLAVAQQVDELADADLDAVGVEPEARRGRLQARDVAVVVRTEQVDAVVRTRTLVAHVRAVGGEVGGASVGADEHAVLVVAERGGDEEQCPVTLVGVAGGGELRDRRLDRTLGVEPALARPHVEAHAEAGELALDALAHACDASRTDRVGDVVDLAVEQPVAVLRAQLGGEAGHVVAVVVVLTERQATVDAHDGRAEAADLLTDVVEVVLARDPVAGRLEQRRDRVAGRGPASRTEVQRTGRVRRHELDVDVLGAPDGPTTVGGTLGEDAVDERRVRDVGQAEVHEPRPGDLDGVDLGQRGELGGERVGELAWRTTRCLRDAQRDRGRPVPVVGVLGALERRVLRREPEPLERSHRRPTRAARRSGRTGRGRARTALR
jgi:hypothetical protein